MNETVYIWTDECDKKTALNQDELCETMKNIIATTDTQNAIRILDDNGTYGLNGHSFKRKKTA